MLTTATGAALASTNGVQAHAAAQAPQLAAVGADDTPAPEDGIVVPGTGNTPASMNECAAYNFCLWKNASWGDPFWSADFFSTPPNTWEPIGSTLNNAGSALWNFRDVSTEVAQFRNGTGLTACIAAGGYVSNLAHIDWPGTTTPMNDSITSFKFDTTNHCTYPPVISG